MKELENYILKEGKVFPGNILKVDSFLNHQVDINLMQKIGEELKEKFKDVPITKVLTIEASGIPPACFAALSLDVPLVFAKKKGSSNIDKNVYVTTVHSYTYHKDYFITVASDYLTENDHVLIVDDFLANGKAVEGLISICNDAKATVEGIGICIEKGFQPGGVELRKQGYHVESLAVVSSIDNGKIEFKEY